MNIASIRAGDVGISAAEHQQQQVPGATVPKALRRGWSWQSAFRLVGVQVSA